MISGADTLVGKLTDKLNRPTSHKLILAHMPLIMVCIEVSYYVLSIHSYIKKRQIIF